MNTPRNTTFTLLFSVASIAAPTWASAQTPLVAPELLPGALSVVVLASTDVAPDTLAAYTRALLDPQALVDAGSIQPVLPAYAIARSAPDAVTTAGGTLAVSSGVIDVTGGVIDMSSLSGTELLGMSGVPILFPTTADGPALSADVTGATLALEAAGGPGAVGGIHVAGAESEVIGVAPIALRVGAGRAAAAVSGIVLLMRGSAVVAMVGAAVALDAQGVAVVSSRPVLLVSANPTPYPYPAPPAR